MRKKCLSPAPIPTLEFSLVEGFREHECHEILRITDTHLDEFLRAWYSVFGGLPQ